MISLETKCEDCTYNEICKYKDNAENAYKKLVDMKWDGGIDDAYYWDGAMAQRRVNVKFSCSMFNKKSEFIFR